MSLRDTSLRAEPAFYGEGETALADVVLTVADDGTILKSWSRETQPIPESEDWVGCALNDLLSTTSQAQILRARRFLDAGNVARARAQITLPLGPGRDLAIQVQLEQGPEGLRLVGQDQSSLIDAVSRADRLQLALETLSEEDRVARGLFHALLSHLKSATVLVDVATGRILDLTKAAVALLDLAGDVAGTSPSNAAFTQCFEGRRRSEFIDSLCAAATANRSVMAALRTDRGDVTVRPEMARAGDSVILICHLTLVSEDDGDDGVAGFAALSDGSPDGMVCLRSDGTITHANPAFQRMVGATSGTMLDDRPMAGFLLRGAIDVKAMTDPRRPRTFASHLIGLTGLRLPVEIAVSDLPRGGHGLILRDITLSDATRGTPDVAVPEGQSTTLGDPKRQVGNMPLRDIVAGMTDAVEKDCVEAALALTQNNRVAAAEMLGLSRQSLYVKLRKFGLLDKGDQ